MRNFFLVAAVISFLIASLISLYLYTAQKSITLTSEIRKCKRNINVYKPRTGDIVLLQARSHGVFNIYGFEAGPTHCGLVWVKNGEVLVVENTIFSGKKLRDVFWGRDEESHPFGGVRVIRLADLIRKVDGFLSIRSLKSGAINEEKFQYELINWARNIKFDYLRLTNMGLHLTIGMTFNHISKFLSNIFIKKDFESFRSPDIMFCSEFIFVFLQRLGHIQKDLKNYWEFTPIFLSSSMNVIDTLSRQSNDPLTWSKDQPILCPFLLD
jgi:hypothetical protein